MSSLYECVSKPSKACEDLLLICPPMLGRYCKTPIRFDDRLHSRGYSAKQSAARAELSYATCDQPAVTILWGNSRGSLASSHPSNYSLVRA